MVKFNSPAYTVNPGREKNSARRGISFRFSCLASDFSLACVAGVKRGWGRGGGFFSSSPTPTPLYTC